MPFIQDNPLAKFLHHVEQMDYPVHSRIHKLKSIPNCYVKREDELGFGISGSKIRKYRSLIPFLIREKIRDVILIGGANSNHVLGLTQLLIENGIRPILFLRGSFSEYSQNIYGNLFFLKFFINLENVHWIARKNWSEVIQIASQMYSKAFILAEGGMHPNALPGLITLALDINRNEEMLNLSFKHIFVDAGTGFTAISLLLAFAFHKKESLIHPLLLADEKEIFLNKLHVWHQEFEKMIGAACPFPYRFCLHQPKNAKSFGSTNKKLFEEIKDIAKTEGFLTDPIYSGKLFYESKRIVDENKISEPSLLIHSGGGLTLTGFSRQIR